MPKVNLYWFDNAVANLGKQLKAWQRHRNCSSEEMGVRLRFCANTWNSRMRSPEKLTVEEVWKAANYLKIPPNEAVAMLTAGLESLKKN